MIHEITLPDGTVISDDPARLDLALIHGFLSEQSYWAQGRPRAMVERTVAFSLCLGAYGPQGQIGFARAVTDRAVFAWMSDVFILPVARGKGIGRALVAALLDHPELATIVRWLLVTRDAHGLYESFGFTRFEDPARLMALLRPRGR
jgi:GNAT superfamily N-acetyltransferase